LAVRYKRGQHCERCGSNNTAQLMRNKGIRAGV
jgi:hypothetical protein